MIAAEVRLVLGDYRGIRIINAREALALVST
jgi:hypothetical protein